MSPDALPRAAAVMPVRGAGALLAGALDALREQREALPEVIVVDDSPDGSLGAIDGARVLASGGRGPYAARNVGWRSTDAEVILFCDVRSRPLAGWAQQLAACFDDPSVALAGSNVIVRGDRTLAQRAGERHQFFDLRKYVERPFFRPYLPTCNLGVRRADLDAVGGFPEVRSGGDAELCWRVLDRPGRRLATVPETLMEWVPRDGVLDYLEQSYRYGGSNRALRERWQSAGAAVSPPVPGRLLARRSLRAAARTASGFAAGPEARAAALVEWARLSFDLGYRAAAAAGRAAGDR